MKHLVHFSFPYFINHSVVILNEIQNLTTSGNEVDILLCGEGVNHCYGNTLGDKRVCRVCRKMQKLWLDCIPANTRVLFYKDYITKEIINNSNLRIFQYKSPEEIRDLTYKKVQIGFGAISSYVSRSRNLEPVIDKRFRDYFDNLLRTQCIVTDLLENYINKEQPQKITLFNGRHFEVRPFFDFTTASNIPLECIELGFSNREDSFMVFNFNHNLPHNLKNLNEIIENTWRTSYLDKEDKETIGKSFFENKRRNIPTGDKVYTGNQTKGLLPDGWDLKRRNFVIFNSSEDEFFAVGKDFTGLALFENQIAGIKAIAKLLQSEKDIHLYLRVHPNLKNIKYRYHLGLYDLSKEFENLTIIDARNPISTYSLIDYAEKVITFGSTVGIEAAFSGKPSILLSGTTYYYLDVCYIPHSIEELRSMLLTKLSPKKNEPALKFGFYKMSDKGKDLDAVFFQRTKYIPFRPLKINVESYSSLFLRFIFSFIINRWIEKQKLQIPVEGY